MDSEKNRPPKPLSIKLSLHLVVFEERAPIDIYQQMREEYGESYKKYQELKLIYCQLCMKIGMKDK